MVRKTFVILASIVWGHCGMYQSRIEFGILIATSTIQSAKQTDWFQNRTLLKQHDNLLFTFGTFWNQMSSKMFAIFCQHLSGIFRGAIARHGNFSGNLVAILNQSGAVESCGFSLGICELASLDQRWRSKKFMRGKKHVLYLGKIWKDDTVRTAWSEITWRDPKNWFIMFHLVCWYVLSMLLRATRMSSIMFISRLKSLFSVPWLKFRYWSIWRKELLKPPSMISAILLGPNGARCTCM